MDSIDLFNFDWKVPIEKVVEIKKWVYSWGRIPFKDYHAVLDQPLNVWFKTWWEAALLKNKLFFVIAALAPVSILLLKIIYKKLIQTPFVFAFVAAYIIFIFWFFTAPDIRFSFAPILFLALLPLFLLQKPIDKVLKAFNPLFVVCLFYYLYLIGEMGYTLFCIDYFSLKNTSEYYYLPIDISITNTRKKAKFNTILLKTKSGKMIEFYEPTLNHTLCFDKFPCSLHVDRSLKMRGEELQDGFRY